MVAKAANNDFLFSEISSYIVQYGGLSKIWRYNW